MPSHSEKQRKMIFAKRSQYKTKENTPKKWKWIWEKGWEKLEESLTSKFNNLYESIISK